MPVRPIRVRRGIALAALTVWPFYLAAQSLPDRGAAQGQIAGYVAKADIPQALAAYDAYVGATKKPDAPLLRPIAVAELSRLARAYPTDAVLYPGALERLARAGDADALKRLKHAAAAVPPSAHGIEALAGLARLDDPEAARRLGQLVTTVSGNERFTVIQAIEAANARGQGAAVAALLNDPDVNVRRLAARAVGRLQYKEAIPQLKALVERDHAIVGMFAAAALKRMGDASGDALVSQMLAGHSPDMRLEAARAYAAAKPSTSRAQWIDQVKTLGTDRDPLARVKAAEVLACCDAATSRAILNEALGDPLPPMRVEAARVYELTDLADATVARRLLGDSWDHVRLHGAGAAVRLADRAAAKK